MAKREKARKTAAAKSRKKARPRKKTKTARPGIDVTLNFPTFDIYSSPVLAEAVFAPAPNDTILFVDIYKEDSKGSGTFNNQCLVGSMWYDSMVDVNKEKWICGGSGFAPGEPLGGWEYEARCYVETSTILKRQDTASIQQATQRQHSGLT